jgi:hypothetical protein
MNEIGISCREKKPNKTSQVSALRQSHKSLTFLIMLRWVNILPGLKATMARDKKLELRRERTKKKIKNFCIVDCPFPEEASGI